LEGFQVRAIIALAKLAWLVIFPIFLIGFTNASAARAGPIYPDPNRDISRAISRAIRDILNRDIREFRGRCRSAWRPVPCPPERTARCQSGDIAGRAGLCCMMPDVSPPYAGETAVARCDVVSEVAGRVWRLAAAVGDRRAAEEPILIVESMKMEIPIVAPAAGTVVEVRVAFEDPVAEGQVVAVIELGA